MGGMTNKLVLAGLTDMHLNVQAAANKLLEAVQEFSFGINYALATTPDARAYAAFVKDGGDPQIIKAIERAYDVRGLP